MSKKLVLMAVLVMAMAGVSFGVQATTGFNTFEDIASYAAGDLNGQGSNVDDWAGAWTTYHTSGNDPTGFFEVTAGGHPDDPDQHLQFTGVNSSGYYMERQMDPWSGDFKMSFALKYERGGSANIDPFSIVLQDAAGNNALHIKAGGTGWPMFIVNNEWMIVQNGDGAYPDAKNLHAEWVKMMVTCEWATQTFRLWWEQNDGSMLQLNAVEVGWKDAAFDGTVTQFKINPSKMYGDMDNSVLFDNLVIEAPEPMTMTLLGLGGLALIRRKRA